MDTSILPSAGSRTNQLTGGSPDNTQAFIASPPAPMDFMAKETGGQLLLPGRNKNLSRIEEDTRSYYWLGFTHSGADDRRRDLKVEVLQLAARGPRLRHHLPAVAARQDLDRDGAR